ncbi:hypothetical protein C8R44DRAFT_899814 [Mycena epipterygia]|nr:hypothetical protein C8R44DRAFT_899814 [Mycena epipterygia]
MGSSELQPSTNTKIALHSALGNFCHVPFTFLQADPSGKGQTCVPGLRCRPTQAIRLPNTLNRVFSLEGSQPEPTPASGKAVCSKQDQRAAKREGFASEHHSFICDPMSVPELCAQLEELGSAIQTQKAVLEDLERSKVDVLRQLNHLRDPITRLPPEITSEIFLQCLPVHNECHHPSRAPLILLSICSSWTDRALSTGALWTELALKVPRNSTIQYPEHVARSLARAHGQPLSVAYFSPHDFDFT